MAAGMREYWEKERGELVHRREQIAGQLAGWRETLKFSLPLGHSPIAKYRKALSSERTRQP